MEDSCYFIQFTSCSFQMHGGSAKFSDLYELQEDIGVGSYSICKRCVHRVSAMDYAVKVQLEGFFFKFTVHQC